MLFSRSFCAKIRGRAHCQGTQYAKFVSRLTFEELYNQSEDAQVDPPETRKKGGIKVFMDEEEVLAAPHGAGVITALAVEDVEDDDFGYVTALTSSKMVHEYQLLTKVVSFARNPT